MTKKTTNELNEIVDTILNKDILQIDSKEVCQKLFVFFNNFANFEKLNYLNSSNLTISTKLSSGVALSPAEAAACIIDSNRTISFLRGIYSAITELEDKFKNEKLHILYAGTGPYATLILPLLHLLDSKKIEVTFLDIHQSSLDIVENIIKYLNLETFVKEYICDDATTYKVSTKTHMIVSETMKASLEREPQVNITLNLLPQLCEGGVFLPQKINVSLQNETGEKLCDILELDTSKNLSAKNILKTKEYKFSQKISSELFFITQILIYGKYKIEVNESFLTTPEKLDIDAVIFKDDIISFEYDFIHNPKIKYNIKSALDKNLTLSSDSKIRELLNPSSKSIEKNVIVQSSNSAISNILSSTKSLENYESTKNELGILYDNFKGIFDFAKIPMELRDRQFLNKTGYAMSPAHAITTINDVFRVSGFVRAIDLAIKDLKETFKEETLHIVYPACGPLAPLLLPLLIYYNLNNTYTSKDIKITFIDIQQGAILALANLLKLLQLDDYVYDIKCIDAVEYKKDTDIHLVILEAMQHGFTREGHLSISKHFASLLHKDGIFLPQNVKITAILVQGEEEFNTQFKDIDFASSFTTSKNSLDKRIELGDILNVNLDTLRNMKILELDANTRLVKCSEFTLPDFDHDQDKYILLFSTNIHIYKDEYINEYDSGITHPLPNLNICINFIPNDMKDEDLYVRSGDKINFFYKLVGIPGFLVTKGENNG